MIFGFSTLDLGGVDIVAFFVGPTGEKFYSAAHIIYYAEAHKVTLVSKELHRVTSMLHGLPMIILTGKTCCSIFFGVKKMYINGCELYIYIV